MKIKNKFSRGSIIGSTYLDSKGIQFEVKQYLTGPKLPMIAVVAIDDPKHRRNLPEGTCFLIKSK